MRIEPGIRLGVYEVLSLLGEGGMAEVYKARDTRLGRSVAIKVLHPHIALDPGLRLRFEREARAVSQLNHPHICTLYDVGRHADREFLVMEFVEGESLYQRLRRGPLPLEAAVRTAIEIAEGLDHAHHAGITHRDLKPANIVMTRLGAKLLDFGLAKLRDRGVALTGSLDRAVNRLEQLRAEDPAARPTDAGPLTDAGMVLGTFEYMAPEQLEGREADERTDLFALGVIVYEMVTGRLPCESPTRAGLIGAILATDPPPMTSIRAEVPPLLERTVHQLLVKEPDDRWHSAHDVLVALRWVADNLPMGTAGSTEPARRSRVTMMAALAVVAASAGLFLWNLTTGRAAPSEGPQRWDVAIPGTQSLATELVPSLAVSPDGMYLVVRAQSGNDAQLYVRAIDQFEARAIPGSTNAHTPFFSPDGRWIGFIANSRIFKVPVGGGQPQLVCAASSLSPGSPGATWGTDGTIVFAAGTSGLLRVLDTGGVPEPFTQPDASRGELTHISPQFLPGGSELLFTVRTTDNGWRLAVMSLKTRTWTWLPPLGEVAGARYVNTGHLLYAQSGGLHAIAFDLSRHIFNGASFPIADDVYTQIVTDALVAQFAVSDSGVLAFVSGRPADWTLVSVDMSGRATPFTDTAHVYRYPRFSPDGKRVAVTVEEEQQADIYIAENGGAFWKLTSAGSNTTPVWGPGEEHVTFASRGAGSDGFDIYSMPLDQRTDPERLVSAPGTQVPSAWSRRGDVLAYYELNNKTARDVWTWSPGATAPRAVVDSEANERAAGFSPDGNWMTYVSNESGRDEIYVRRFPGPGGQEPVSRGGGTEPVWGSRGDIFYRHGGHLMAVTVHTGSTVTHDTPRELFDDTYVAALSEAGRPNYDISPDGSRFVMVKSVNQSPTHLHVFRNWPQFLRAGANR